MMFQYFAFFDASLISFMNVIYNKGTAMRVAGRLAVYVEFIRNKNFRRQCPLIFIEARRMKSNSTARKSI